MKKRSNARNMAPKPPTAEDPGALPPEANGSTVSEIDKANGRDAAEMFTKMRRECGSGAYVSLHRAHPGSGQFKSSYIGRVPIDQFSIDAITQTYGGGDYTARGTTAAGTFATEQRFSIDHTIAPKNPMAPQGEKREPQQDAAGIIREVVAAMPKQNDSPLVEIVKAALARPEQKGETLAVLEMIKDMREESRRSEDRFLKLMEKMNERAAPAPAPSLREQIEDAKELIDLLGGNGGAAEKPESFWKEIGKSAAEALVPLVKAHFAAGGGPALPGARSLTAAPTLLTSPAASSPSSPAAAAGAEINVTNTNQPAAVAAEPPEMNSMLAGALRQFRAAAINAAKKGSDAYEFVDGTLGFVPPNFHDRIFNTANQEDWFDRIFGGEPEATKYIQFIGEVRDSILAKAFIVYVTKCAAANDKPDLCAKSFLEWVSSGFDGALQSMAEDPENWKEAFAGAGIDAAWLESLRTAILSNFQGADVVPITEPAAAAAPVQATAAPAAAAVTKKKARGAKQI